MSPESPEPSAEKTTGAYGARKRRGLRVLVIALAVLGAAGAAEMLYRARWTLKSRELPCGGESGFFSLYVTGESTAAGEPYNWDGGPSREPITLAALVGSLLGDRLAGRKIKIFNLARSGESVYPQSMALEQALRLRSGGGPGVVLIYAGHADAMPPRGILPLQWFREKVLYRSMLLGDLSFYAEKKLPFLRVRTRQTFEYHLRRIVEMSLQSGLVPVLATAAANLADIDPGLFPAEAEDREVPGPFRPRLPRAEIEELLGKGLALEEQGRREEAARYYSGQAGAHPQISAYLEYRIGKCYQAAGRYKEAGRSFQRAVDRSAFDNFPRATSRQNDFIRALAKQYSLPLVDTVKIFEQRSPNGLLGSGLFADGCHPNMEGYILLSNAFARTISQLFNAPVNKQWAGPEDVFRVFSYGKESRANAFVTSGRYLFNVAAWHARPGQRLNAASSHFISALELDPDNFSAWLALGWTETALRSTLLSESESLYWLLKHGLLTYHCGEYSIGPGQLRAVLQKLAAYGPPDGIIAVKLPRGAAIRQGLSPDKNGQYRLTRSQLLAILEKLYARRGGGGNRTRKDPPAFSP